MGRREPLTEEERERIYRARLEGEDAGGGRRRGGGVPLAAPASGGGEGEMKG